MNDSAILTDIQDGCFEIRFNREDKKNAITAQMYLDMADAIQQAEADESVKLIAIVGTDKVFSAGNDLKDFLENPPHGDDSPVWQYLAAISKAKKPIIAGVNGPAIGIGTTLLMHCDFVVASDSAIFSMPFTSLGLCPEAGSSLLLPLLVGHRKATEWLMLGTRFDAAEAYRTGLINQAVASPEQVNDVLAGWKKQLTKLPHQALLTTKRLIKQSHSAQIAEQISVEGAEFTELLKSDDAKAAFSAFLSR